MMQDLAQMDLDSTPPPSFYFTKDRLIVGFRSGAMGPFRSRKLALQAFACRLGAHKDEVDDMLY